MKHLPAVLIALGLLTPTVASADDLRLYGLSHVVGYVRLYSPVSPEAARGRGEAVYDGPVSRISVGQVYIGPSELECQRHPWFQGCAGYSPVVRDETYHQNVKRAANGDVVLYER